VKITDQDGPAAFPRAVTLKGVEDRSVLDRCSAPLFICDVSDVSRHAYRDFLHFDD
jgi:hypothetical protein